MKTTFNLLIPFLMLLTGCSLEKKENQAVSVKDILAAFPVEKLSFEFAELTPQLRDQLIRHKKVSNWTMEIGEDSVIRLTLGLDKVEARIDFAIYTKPRGVVVLINEFIPDHGGVALQGWEGDVKKNSVTNWRKYTLPELSLGDLLDENTSLIDYKESKASYFLDVSLRSDTVHYSINDFYFLKDLQDNDRYDEAKENTYIKYDYVLCWTEGRFVANKLLRGSYDPIPVFTSSVISMESDGPESDIGDCSANFTLKASHEEGEYLSANMLDHHDSTAWTTRGAGQWIEFVCTTNNYTYMASSFTMKNGYLESKDAWKAGGRIKKMKVFVDGNLISRVVLQDTLEEQVFSTGLNDTDVKIGTRIRFEIEDIYQGDKYNDVWISSLVPQGACG